MFSQNLAESSARGWNPKNWWPNQENKSRKFSNEQIVDFAVNTFRAELARLRIDDVENRLTRISASNIKFLHIPDDQFAGGWFKNAIWFAIHDKRDEHKEIEVGEKYDNFDKTHILIHEDVHAISATDTRVGLEHAIFYKGLNEGLTEHYARFLLKKANTKMRIHNFETRFVDMENSHGYSPYVDLWENWLRDIAFDNAQEGEDIESAYEVFRDQIYKYYVKGQPEKIVEFIDRYVAPGAAEAFAKIRPKTSSAIEFDDHVRRREAVVGLNDAREMTEHLKGNADSLALNDKQNPGLYVLGKVISKPFLNTENYDQSVVEAHYKSLITNRLGAKFFSDFVGKSLSSDQITFLINVLSEIEVDIVIVSRLNLDFKKLNSLSVFLNSIIFINSDWRFKRILEYKTALRTANVSESERIMSNMYGAVFSLLRSLEEGPNRIGMHSDFRNALFEFTGILKNKLY